MTDWRELRRTTHDRRKKPGTCLDRADYDWEQPNVLREVPYTYATEPAVTPQKPAQDDVRHEHPVWTAARIKSLRNSLRMTQQEFGAALGLAGKNRKVTVFRYEDGQRQPSEQTCFMLERLGKNLPIIY